MKRQQVGLSDGDGETEVLAQQTSPKAIAQAPALAETAGRVISTAPPLPRPPMIVGDFCAFGPCVRSVDRGGEGCYLCDVVARRP